MKVNIHQAKTNHSKLIAAAESGEAVIIARNGKPAVKRVLAGTAKPSRRNLMGSGFGKLWIADDFNSPETNAAVTDLFEVSRDLDRGS